VENNGARRQFALNLCQRAFVNKHNNASTIARKRLILQKIEAELLRNSNGEPNSDN
jgi:hypothetical protein